MAKDEDLSLGARANAAKDAAKDKVKETANAASSEYNKQKS